MEGEEPTVERVRALCPIDVTALTAWSRTRWLAVVGGVAALTLFFAVLEVQLVPATIIVAFQAVAVVRAMESLDSVEALRLAVDDGWFQAVCARRTGTWSFHSGVLTVSGGLVRLDADRSEQWPVHLVRLGRVPRLFGAGGVMLVTPDGPRELTFVPRSSIAAQWSGAVDRSVHRALARLVTGS